MVMESRGTRAGMSKTAPSSVLKEDRVNCIGDHPERSVIFGGRTQSVYSHFIRKMLMNKLPDKRVL